MKFNFRKTTVFFLLFSMICLSLSACRKKEQEPEQPVTYKKTEISLPGATEPSKVSIGKDTVYYTINNNKEENAAETVMAFGMDTQTAEELKISLEAGEKVLRMLETEDNQLILLTYVDQNNALTFYLSKYRFGDLDSSADAETGNCKQEWRTDITGKIQEKYADGIFVLETDHDGNIYLQNGIYYVLIWNPEGTYLCSMRTDDFIQGIAFADGRVWAYASSKTTKSIQPIDLYNEKWGKAKTKNVPNAGNMNGFSVDADEEGHLMIHAGLTLWSYDIKKETESRIFNFSGYDIGERDVYNWKKQDEKIQCVVAYGQDVQLVTFRPATEKELLEEPVVEKQIITINDSGLMQQSIQKFNKTNDKYRIQVVEDKGNNWKERALFRDTEIIAGKSTDLIAISEKSNYRKYADKGILEDLYAYMEIDAAIQKEDFLPNILQIYERQGKLYGITPGFHIRTLTVPTKYAGDGKITSLSEFQEMVQNRPSDMRLCALFDDKFIVFRIFLWPTYDYFIDYENYIAHFDSQEFIDWITFINSIELEEKKEFGDLKELDQTKDMFGLTVLRTVEDYQQDKIGFGNENITFIGYPGKDKCNSFVDAAVTLGIWAQSPNKEGAWEFIKFLLTEEQQNLLWETENWSDQSIPIRISSVEKALTQAMESKYEVDESGNQVEVPHGEAILWSDERVPYYAASKEDIDKMRELITSVSGIYKYEEWIDSIGMEELAPFYEGDKSAEETAKVIQNRVQLYLDEIKP